MPNWTLSDYLSRTTHAVGQRADISASDASFWINQAYFAVAQSEEHALLENTAVSSTTSGEDTIALPADFNAPISLSYLTNVGNSTRTLRQMSPHEKDAKFSLNEIGIPEYYVLYNDNIELHPSPNSAYSLQLRYKSLTTDMAALTDVPSLSTEFRFAVFLKAKEYMWENLLMDPDRADRARNEYLDYITSIPSDNDKRLKTQDRLSASVRYK